jgi:acyl-coenzyme A synthetase/AMP-(fatty) acid ligase
MHDLATPDAGPELIRAWIDCASQLHADKPYIVSIEDSRAIAFGEFARLVRRVGSLLDRGGIGANDRIALLAGNSIEHVACYVGVMAYGATICTVHVEMNRRHIGGILAQLKPRLALCDDDLIHEVALASKVPCLPLGRWSAPAAGTWFAALAACDPGGAHLPQTTPCDDGVIFFTSGTTDRPKGVVLSYREQIGNVTPTADALGLSAADRIYDFRSFNWASAQLFGVLGALCRGATLVMRKKFSATRFFDDIRAHGVTVAAGNPTTISMLLATGHTISAGDVPTLRFMTSSSAPLSEPEWRRFEERFGIPVAQSYGSSETAWIAINPGRERRLGTVGRPLAYHRLAIVDAEGRKLPPGEIGEIEIGAWRDNAYRYLGDDGTTRVNSRGRMRTGDIGYLDGDGFLHLTGRAKDLIIRGGVNISPAEIDSILMQRVEVAEAATIGVPDTVWGEEVVSYVVVRPGEVFAAEDLLRHCADQLPAFKTPKQILLREVLPKSARGKLDRKALVEEWRRVGRISEA